MPDGVAECRVSVRFAVESVDLHQDSSDLPCGHESSGIGRRHREHEPPALDLLERDRMALKRAGRTGPAVRRVAGIAGQDTGIVKERGGA